MVKLLGKLRKGSSIFFVLIFALLLSTVCSSAAVETDKEGEVYIPQWFEIQIIDEDTGRGIPLVELETMDHRRFVSDSAGRIAISEPDFQDNRVFFYWRSHGYEAPKFDGIDAKTPYHGGIEIDIKPGGKEVIKIKRINIAERMYRVTGSGIYRDSVILGYDVPIENPLLNAKVTGADGGTAILYNGKIVYGYGDTNRLDHLWGSFHAPMCISDLPEKGGLDPDLGSNLKYFVGDDGFSKGLWPEITRGVVWPSFAGVFDIDGKESLVMYYTNRDPATWGIMEHGLGIFDDEKEEFKIIHTYGSPDDWRIADGWGVFKHNVDGKDYMYYDVTAYPVVRVPADIESLKDPSAFEAWSCLEDGSSTDPAKAKLLRDKNGKLIYRWTKNAPPVGHNEENAFIKAGLMDPSEAHFMPVDVDTGKLVLAHAGTVHWNEWRQKWVLICISNGGEHSILGDVYYSESDSPNGPFKKAIRVASHYQYSYYNPSYHWFLNQEGGRIIYFDGCYSMSFATNDWTQRYDYNMLRYKLDLSDPRLKRVWED